MKFFEKKDGGSIKNWPSTLFFAVAWAVSEGPDSFCVCVCGGVGGGGWSWENGGEGVVGLDM